ncbi:MAG: TOMM precursor leader peptide-binding protein, partial [Gammaproteobacteria bacterium]
IDAFGKGGSLADISGWLTFTPDHADAARRMRDALVERGVLVANGAEPLATYLGAGLGAATSPAPLADRKVTVVSDAGLGDAVLADLRAAGVGEVRPFSAGDHAGTNGAAPVSGHHSPALPDEQTLSNCFDGASAVVLAWSTFSPTLFQRVNGLSLEHGVPWLLGYVDGSEVIIGPSVLPGESGCYLEYEVQAEASIQQRDAYHLYREERSQASTARGMVISPYARVLSGFLSVVLLRMLTGAEVPTLERVIRVDFERFTVDYQRFLRLPRCPACAVNRAPYRPTFL